MEKKNNLDSQYTKLLEDILENGTKKQTRNGETISVFGRQIRHNMSEGFPLLTTKRMPFKTIVTELIWFLRGDTNIKYLVDNNCHIWDGDAYKNYCKSFENQSILDKYSFDTDPITIEMFVEKIKIDDEFAKKWGELGPIYGKQWRSWNVPRMEPKGFDFNIAWEKSQKIWEPTRGEECGPSFDTFCMSLLRNKKIGMAYGYHTQIDQIQNSINLLKTDPDSRRNRVSAWNVGELSEVVLPPCHTDFQFYTRELSDKERQKWVIDNVDWVKNSEDPEHEANKYLYRGEPKIYGDSVPKRAISLMWNQRSVDTFLGLPFNIASYGLLLEIIAKKVNMVPDQLIGNLGDVHLYSNHIEQAKEQIGRRLTSDEWISLMVEKHGMILEGGDDTLPEHTREPFPLPKLVFNPIFLANLEHNSFDQAINGQIDFELEGYQSHPTIKAPLSN